MRVIYNASLTLEVVSCCARQVVVIRVHAKLGGACRGTPAVNAGCQIAL